MFVFNKKTEMPPYFVVTAAQFTSARLITLRLCNHLIAEMSLE